MSPRTILTPVRMLAVAHLTARGYFPSVDWGYQFALLASDAVNYVLARVSDR